MTTPASRIFTAFDVLEDLGLEPATTTRLLGLLDTAGVDAVAGLPHRITPHHLFDALCDLDVAALANLTGLTGYEGFVQELQDVLGPRIRSRRPTADEITATEAYLATRDQTARA